MWVCSSQLSIMKSQTGRNYFTMNCSDVLLFSIWAKLLINTSTKSTLKASWFHVTKFYFLCLNLTIILRVKYHYRLVFDAFCFFIKANRSKRATESPYQVDISLLQLLSFLQTPSWTYVSPVSLMCTHGKRKFEITSLTSLTLLWY